MKAIDDFELVTWPEDSTYRQRHPEAEPVEIADLAPPHRRLRNLIRSVWGEEVWVRVLLYRGQEIPHLRIDGWEIAAQFETARGYLLFCTSTGWVFSTDLYYILHDFSGADCVGFSAWSQTWWQRSMARLLGRDRKPPTDVSPVAKVIVEDDRNVVFQLRRKGRFRLTLSEDRPRRDWLTLYMVGTTNAEAWHRRNFKIRRLLRRPVSSVVET